MFEKLESIHFGHQEVENNRGWQRLGKHLEGFPTVVGAQGLPSGFLEVSFHGLERADIIVDEKKIALWGLTRDPMDDSTEPIHIDRFDEVILHIQREAIFLLGHDGNHDDGDGLGTGGLFQVVEHLPSVFSAWHHDIEGDRIRQVALRKLQSFVSIDSGDDLVSL